MQKHIATWNPARGVWEVPDTESLICGHSELFSATWPGSGMTRDGLAYALPTSEHPTDDSASSSLLPTPSVSDGTGGHMNRSGDRSHELLLPGVARELALLPTPAVNDMGEGKWTARQKAKHSNGNGHGASLAVEAQRLLQPPTSMDSHSSGGSTPSNVTLTDAVVRESLGARTHPLSDAGKPSADE